MQYEIEKAIEILDRTPKVLNELLHNLSGEWTQNNEGPDTWSPFDVVGHLIHGEKTDWIPRMKIILEHGTAKTFEPFDRFAQYEIGKGKTMADLLSEFEKLRKENMEVFKSLPIKDNLDKKGKHPELGEVTLRNLLSSWTVHDLGHLSQITRVMAKQYTEEVGIWTRYMAILQ
ncbi:DinB family protein [Ekhidna sp. To15]|uniref:DinB family protein n=1 Tax=Ekhidna sp. To15 TaxID=3395267 RepID=UPI003F528476